MPAVVLYNGTHKQERQEARPATRDIDRSTMTAFSSLDTLVFLVYFVVISGYGL